MSDNSFHSDDKFNRYLFEYRHDGSEWGIEIIASSPGDAHARLKSLTWARYQGEIKAKIPVPSAGWFRRLTFALLAR
ncbi:hypothetical protein CPY51_31185 [Rhizobium tubonense]|uniref:Uncharacterized protein n=1 Tax=Rhizobium tubonense TaxID=484088 RepID=A0A2W4CQ57_9HYPH|nr:hypothetical protein CPY51_31185 [Rhizobium tubonense]